MDMTRITVRGLVKGLVRITIKGTVTGMMRMLLYP